VPITFVGTDVTPLDGGGVQGQSAAPGATGYPLTSLGLGSNVLASGDLSYLSNADAARRVLSPDYWEPFFVPARRAIPLDRLVNEIPRDLVPKIEAELAARASGSTQPFAWAKRGFTEPELVSIPDLVRRLDEGGIGSLTPTELAFLRNAAATHIGGSTPGAPFASYSRAGFNVGSVGPKQYRVRIEAPSSGVLDVSGPNEFNLSGTDARITNAEEAEFLLVANAEGRLVSVERVAGAEPAGLLFRYGSEIRWGGRMLFVAGLAVSAYKIAEAPADQKAVVASEEAGGQIGGFLGTAGAVAGCVALGVASGGLGLFLCGLAGGIIGGAAGSAALGGIAQGLSGSTAGPSRPMAPEEVQQTAQDIDRANMGPVCPSCHELQQQWNQRLSVNALPGSGSGLTAADLARISAWINEPEPPR